MLLPAVCIPFFLQIFSILAKETKNVNDERKIYYVYRVWPNSTNEFEFLVTVFKSASKYHLNFWRDPVAVGIPMDIMVPDSSKSMFENMLNVSEIRYTIIIHDVERLIIEREWKNRSNDKTLLDDTQPAPKIDFNIRSYQNFENVTLDSVRFFVLKVDLIWNNLTQINKYLRDLQNVYPSIAKVYSLGSTWEQREMEVIKIGSSLLSSNKKAIWIDAGIHAREWISITTALYIIRQLVTKYESDKQIKEYVDKLDWYILPVANPDGYEYTRTSSDPQNRNFDFHWNEVGSVNDSCHETYAGQYAFSELETQAIRNFLTPRKNNVQAFVTLHSYAQAILYPYGYSRNKYPEDVAQLRTVGIQAAQAIQALYNTPYEVASGADRYYAASGSSGDWAKDSLNTKYSYIIELRPGYNQENGFVLHEMQILPTAKETWEGIKVIADAVLQDDGWPRSSSNSMPSEVKNCVDTEDQCRWLSSIGGCFIWKDIDQRCPWSCRVCDQNEE